MPDGCTATQAAHVVSRLQTELVDLGVAPSAAEVHRTNEAQVRLWLAENGIPESAISLGREGLKVNENELAIVAGIVPHSGSAPFGPDFLQELQERALARPWSIGDRQFVATINRPHGRVTTPGALFDFSDLNIRRAGLLDELLSQIVPGSTHHPVALLQRSVSWLVKNPNAQAAAEAQRILGTPTAQLAHSDARGLLDLLGQVSSDRQLKHRTRSEYVGSFRATLVRAYELAGQERPYFPKGGAPALPSEGRRLVSDQPDPDAIDPDMRPAITEVAYGSFEQGSARAIGHLEDRMQRIRIACDKDIEDFLVLRRWFAEVAQLNQSVESRQYADRLYGFYLPDLPSLHRWLEEAPLEQVVGSALLGMQMHQLHARDGYLKRMQDRRSIHLGPALSRLHRKFPSLNRWSAHQARPGRLSGFRSLLANWYVPRWIQLAVELRIQMETSFNRHTVRNLTVDGVQIENATINLQALKGKTEKMQPGCIDSADRLLIAALNLMIEHTSRVQRFWDATETRLFITLVRPKSGDRFDTGTDFQLLQRFIQHHRLFPFSREQLRNQRTSKVYLERGDLHEVQGLLGHESLKTVNTYIGSRVISILNSANIAHFQRSLAASIIWAVRGPSEMRGMNLDQREVSERLLFPIGAQSGDDRLSACDQWLAEQGSSVRIDELSIRHLVAQRRYYATNWQKIRATSPEAYEKVHRPRMEFTAALWAVVADSEHSELLEALA